jgi:hypothetical protein
MKVVTYIGYWAEVHAENKKEQNYLSEIVAKHNKTTPTGWTKIFLTTKELAEKIVREYKMSC